MIITVQTEGVETSYEIDNVSDVAVKREINTVIQKIGQLNVSIEAYQYAAEGHRANLQSILIGRQEAIVEPEEVEAESEEASEEDVNS